MSGPEVPVKETGKPAVKRGSGLTPGGGGRKPGKKSLTVPQKAEAAALWRAGAITLDGLSKKFKMRPETFSRLFARMGIEKGSGETAAIKKVEEAMSARTLSDVEETIKRISQVKESHYKMSRGLAMMAFDDLRRAREAEVDVGKLKDKMAVYKMVTEIIGNSRKELFEILSVEKHERDGELDDLPELTVRELTQGEVSMMSEAEEDTMDTDLGSDMLDLDDSDGGL